MTAIPADVDQTISLLARHDYLAGRALATPVFLALALQRPLLLEGEAGVGKTELAKVLATAFNAPLIRLQCYEGLDISQAAYEWNVARQMLEIRLAEVAGAGQSSPTSAADIAHDLYRRELLIERPLLSALTSKRRPVLLIDELDRADEPFEAFLLELLSEYQMTIPELGPIRAEQPPIVLITSNRTREIHDALKRRCLYTWVDYPDAATELDIVRRKAPGVSEQLAKEVVRFVQSSRAVDLFKPPGVAETIDWAQALQAMNTTSLDSERIDETLGVLLKYQDDIERVRRSDIKAMMEGRLPPP
ncbi:MAG: MoxR family ATPase [Burkholderiaceae bacterium]